MSRKPADKLRPDQSRDAIWKDIRAFNGALFTISDIEFKVDLCRDTIKDYLTGLVKAGYLDEIKPAEKFQPTEYRLIRNNGQEAPRVRKDGTMVTQGLAREQMWRALGIFSQKGKTFTVRDLTLFASTALIPVAETDAKHYCACLYHTGYLVEVEPGSPGKLTVFRMPPNKWTGAKPVQIQRTRRCYDPNNGTVAHVAVISVEGGE